MTMTKLGRGQGSVGVGVPTLPSDDGYSRRRFVSGLRSSQVRRRVGIVGSIDEPSSLQKEEMSIRGLATDELPPVLWSTV